MKIYLLLSFNPNKAGLFEGRFFWEGGVRGVGVGQFDPRPSYFQKNLSNINITLYNC